MDTQPTPMLIKKREKATDEIRIENLDPVNYALHNLTYACVLLPRLPQHYLVGELATFLNQWVIQLCLAFGWRLEHLAIRPNYFHWVSVVQPDISPAHMVQNLREHLSKRIFVRFPCLASENPSGDFWALGYLIINGRDPLPYRLVEDFINETRYRQGSSRHPNGA
jgi:REP element-mobilizing transposase RayT